MNRSNYSLKMTARETRKGTVDSAFADVTGWKAAAGSAFCFAPFHSARGMNERVVARCSDAFSVQRSAFSCSILICGNKQNSSLFSFSSINNRDLKPVARGSVASRGWKSLFPKFPVKNLKREGQLLQTTGPVGANYLPVWSNRVSGWGKLSPCLEQPDTPVGTNDFPVKASYSPGWGKRTARLAQSSLPFVLKAVPGRGRRSPLAGAAGQSSTPIQDSIHL